MNHFEATSAIKNSSIQNQLDRIDNEINVNRELSLILSDKLYRILRGQDPQTESVEKPPLYSCPLEESLGRFADFVSYTNRIIQDIHNRIEL
jgi:hypothetical protein